MALLIFYTPATLYSQDNTETSSHKSKFSEEILNKSQNISDEIMSPYCPGRTLSSCPSNDARILRTDISSMLEKGYSEQAVIRQLKGIYGSAIIGKPETSGFGIFAWTAPFIIIAFILIFIFKILWQLRNNSQNIELDISDKSKTELPDDIQKELDKRITRRQYE